MGAYQYAELIARLLDTFEYLDPRPINPTEIQIPKDNPNAFFWRAKITFRDGKVLNVLDSALFDDDGRAIERSFKYDFRDQGTKDLHFRICNHCRKQAVGEPCHVHVGPQETRLDCFPTSDGKDFSYAIHCVKNFYLGKPQDWGKEAENESNA